MQEEGGGSTVAGEGTGETTRLLGRTEETATEVGILRQEEPPRSECGTDGVVGGSRVK